MKKYLIAACLFMVNNEIVSLVALLIMGAMFIFDMAGWVEEKGKW